MSTFGSLFAGIGGIDLGLERAGWTCKWQVEWEPFCQRVLAKHWPDVPRYGDITTVDWSTVEPVDLLAGGFPCQPVSSAGKQQAQADARWLWPEFARAIRALRPSFVLVENVRNLLSANGGSAFGDVLGDLAASGYDAEWDCIPASAIGAPHQRDRLWLVAYANDTRSSHAGEGDARSGQLRTGAAQDQPASGRGDGAYTLADAPILRLPRQGPRRDAGDSETAGGGQATQPLDGRLADFWLVEPNVGRVANGVPQRVDRLRSLGNAVVPQVVEFVASGIAGASDTGVR